MVALAGCARAPATSNVPAEGSGTEARRLVAAGALLLDVRTPEEYGARHLDGAINVPVDELQARIAEVPAGRQVVVYCASGRRSARAAELLKERGYSVYNLGSIDDW